MPTVTDDLKQVTDNPQILSGSTLAIFDPHHAFTSSGGTTIDWVQNPDQYADQLSGFSFFLPPSERKNSFPNTIIRLPLRTAAGAAKSCIKKEIVEPTKMRQLFNDFIKEELSIVLLFLMYVSCIEIYEVDDHGEKCLAIAQLVKSPPGSDGVSSVDSTTYRCNVDVTADILGSVSQSWRILHATYSDSKAATLLSDRLGYDVGPILKAQKLLPKVGIAIPIPPSSQNDGRLYTYLPLPLSTGFPCHVHGLFALTPDRQHLRNGEETGVVEGVDRSVAFYCIIREGIRLASLIINHYPNPVFSSHGTASSLTLSYHLPGRHFFRSSLPKISCQASLRHGLLHSLSFREGIHYIGVPCHVTFFVLS